MPTPDELDLTRRQLLIAGAAGVTAAALHADAIADPPATAPSAPPDASATTMVTLTVNGRRRELDLDPRTSLLDALREHLHLTGSKKGCDQGQCGACTVMVGGRRTLACLTLAVMHDGDEVTTIEGLGTPQAMHPMQAAFVKHDGFQCGYCTPGQICSAVAALNEIKANVPSHVTADLAKASEITAEELRERMSGNLCRCGAYSNIIDAIGEVAGLDTANAKGGGR